MARSEPAGPAVAAPEPPDGGSPSATQLAKSAGVIGIATLTSRILGLVRDQVLAYLFGAGNAMDAFNVAYRIPNLMRDLFAEGAMSAAFVPTFTRRLTEKGKAAAWQLGNQLINALVLVTGVLVLLGILFAGPLARLLAGDYADVPGKLELTVTLTRVMLPFLTLVAVAAALMGMLNSLNRFFTPALSPAMFNIGIILSAAVLVPIMPGLGLDPITGIAIGAMIGGIGQIALQVPALLREGYRYRPELNPGDPGLRHVLRLIGPSTLAGAAVQINLLVNTILATRRRYWRGVVVELRLSVDVPPDRPFRRLDRHGNASGHLPGRGSRRVEPRATDDLERPAHDAHAQHAGLGRADRARRPDRRADLRTR